MVNELRTEGGAPKGTGLFIRDYLREHNEAYPSEVHKAYKDAYRGLKTLKGRTRRLGTYNSFMTYVSKLILAGLVERTGKVEESDNPKARALEYPERIYVRLTHKGERALDFIWLHPLRIFYYPLDWERVSHRDYTKEGS